MNSTHIAPTDTTITLTVSNAAGNKSTAVEVKPNTPAVKANGLDELFDNIVTDNKGGVTAADVEIVAAGGSVDLKLIAEKVTEAAIKADTDKIKSDLPSNKVIGLILDLSLFKLVTPLSGETTQTKLITLPHLIDVVIDIPTELQGKDGIVIYRVHEGIAEMISTTKNDDGEYIKISDDGKYLTMYINKFSTYAIAYTDNNLGNNDKPGGNEKIPDTSDSSNMTLWILMLVSSGALLVIGRRRIKKI